MITEGARWFGFPPPGRWAAAFATTVAALLALATAHGLGASQPWWAAMTVWLVAQPTRALMIGRMAARLTGTAIGASIGALLLASPVGWTIKLAMLGGWLALCAGCGSQFRHFRGYGFVLAGYTASIVLLTGWGASATPLALAFDRLLCTTLGIVAAAVASLFYMTAVQPTNLAACLADAEAAVLERAAQALGGAAVPDVQPLIAPLAALARDLDESGAGAAQEDRVGLLLELVALTQTVEPMSGDRRAAIKWAVDEITEGRTVERIGLRDRFAHRDAAVVARSAARPVLALAVAVGFWCLTGWDHGPTLVITATLFATLLSNNPQGGLALAHVLAGTASGALAGAATRVLILPVAATTIELMLVIAPVLFAGAWLMHRPRTAKLAIDLNLTFLLTARPFDDALPSTTATIGQCAATIAGVIITLAIYRLVLPATDRAQRNRLVGRVRRLSVAIRRGRAGEVARRALRGTVLQLLRAGDPGDALVRIALRSLANAAIRVRTDSPPRPAAR